MSESKPTVGFVGVGLMGHGMAKNLVSKGWPLVVLGHRKREPVEHLKSLGAREAATPRELAAQCEIVHLCVTGSPQVEEVVAGPNGLLAGAGKGLVIVDTSTSEPDSTARMREACAAKGVSFIDAPLALQRYCKEKCGVVLGTGIGDLSGQAFRIAHMGHVNAPMVLGTLAVIETGLVALAIPHGEGGVRAAVEWLGRSVPA